MIWEIISSILFDGHAPFVSEFTKGLQNVRRNQRHVCWLFFSVYFASGGKKKNWTNVCCSWCNRM